MNREPIKGINPGIIPWVKWLQDKGFHTVDSGDGETHDFECDRDWPYVVMRVLPPTGPIPEAIRLMNCLQDIGVEVVEVGTVTEAGQVQIQYSFDPANGIGMLDMEWPKGFGYKRTPVG